MEITGGLEKDEFYNNLRSENDHEYDRVLETAGFHLQNRLNCKVTIVKGSVTWFNRGAGN